MREAHERDTGDDTDTEPDSRTDAAAGHGNDSRRSAIPIVRDSTTRIALALVYRQRVEGTQIASGAAGTAPRDDREDRADRTPDEGDQGSGPPPGKDTGVQGDDHLGENAHSRELARRPARGTGLPVSARELPNARDVLPNLEKAEIDERKFSEYSMNPGHPDNKGKADGWRALGYDVDSPQARREAARELRELTLEESLANGKIAEVRDDSYGARPRVISGIIGPNGKNATLVTCWLIEDRSGTAIPRLITTWVQPHRDKEAGQ
jgi:hypothetical protein